MVVSRPTLDSDSLDTAKPDWETFCIKVADSILAQQDPERLLEVRGRLYELMSHCIPPVLILKVRRVPPVLSRLAFWGFLERPEWES